MIQCDEERWASRVAGSLLCSDAQFRFFWLPLLRLFAVDLASLGVRVAALPRGEQMLGRKAKAWDGPVGAEVHG